MVVKAKRCPKISTVHKNLHECLLNIVNLRKKMGTWLKEHKKAVPKLQLQLKARPWLNIALRLVTRLPRIIPKFLKKFDSRRILQAREINAFKKFHRS